MDFIACNVQVQQGETQRPVGSKIGYELPTKQTPTTQEDSELRSRDNQGGKFHLEVFPKLLIHVSLSLEKGSKGVYIVPRRESPRLNEWGRMRAGGLQPKEVAHTTKQVAARQNGGCTGKPGLETAQQVT